MYRGTMGLVRKVELLIKYNVTLREQKNFVTQLWRCCSCNLLMLLKNWNSRICFAFNLSLWSCVAVHHCYKKRLYVNRNQVFLQIHWIEIGTFQFIVLIRCRWHGENSHSTHYLQLMMHKRRTTELTNGTETENLRNIARICRAC